MTVTEEPLCPAPLFSPGGPALLPTDGLSAISCHTSDDRAVLLIAGLATLETYQVGRRTSEGALSMDDGCGIGDHREKSSYKVQF